MNEAGIAQPAVHGTSARSSDESLRCGDDRHFHLTPAMAARCVVRQARRRAGVSGKTRGRIPSGPLAPDGVARSLNEARERSLPIYYNGQACPKGHQNPPRYRSSQKCVTCARKAASEACVRKQVAKLMGEGMTLPKISVALKDLGAFKKSGRPFVHILSDWSPVMFNVGPLLMARRSNDEASA